MLSSDHKVETTAQLVELIKEYIESEKEYLKLTLTEKIVKILSSLVIIFLAVLFLFLFLIFAGLAVASIIATYLGITLALTISAGLIVIFFLFIYAQRKSLIEKPLVKLIASIILSK